jgi:hypothetical protein
MPDFIKSEAGAIERPPMPETERERSAETRSAAEKAPAAEQISEAVAPTTAAPATTAARGADPVVASIESILAEDLYEHFNAMPPALQAAFREKGNDTVAKLNRMVSQAAIKAKEVLKLIVGWLKLIPGVNKYFLEQESKIKTDKILELHRRQHPDS